MCQSCFPRSLMNFIMSWWSDGICNLKARYGAKRSRLESYSWIKREIWPLSIQDLIVLKCHSMAKPCRVICHCVWLCYKILFDSKSLQWKEYWIWSQIDPDSWPVHIRDAIHIDSNMSVPSRSCTKRWFFLDSNTCSATCYLWDMKQVN